MHKFYITILCSSLASWVSSAYGYHQEPVGVSSDCSSCGTDGFPFCDTANQIQYPNVCQAKCRGLNASQYSSGPCRKRSGPTYPLGCMCTQEYAPVCTLDGKRGFGNRCAAKCSGFNSTQVRPGRCNSTETPSMPLLPLVPSPALLCSSNCNERPSPVCAADGRREFINSCHAVCMGARNFTVGQCQWTNEPCVCSKIYSPVCVMGRRTYGNECAARCEGFDRSVPGECPPQPPLVGIKLVN